MSKSAMKTIEVKLPVCERLNRIWHNTNEDYDAYDRDDEDDFEFIPLVNALRRYYFIALLCNDADKLSKILARSETLEERYIKMYYRRIESYEDR